MVYFVAALAASAAFVAAGWRGKRAAGVALAPGPFGLSNDLLGDTAETELLETQADAGTALHLALQRLAPVLASQSIKVDIAAPVGLLVRMRGVALVDLLEELLAIVLHGAPASRILLTAAAHGERIYIGISDDIPGADADIRRAGVRGLMERIAMRGGMLDIDVRPTEGTTMTLRLSAVRTDKAGWAVAEPMKTDALKTGTAKAPATTSTPFINSDTSH
jgi:hypothetical protein